MDNPLLTAEHLFKLFDIDPCNKTEWKDSLVSIQVVTGIFSNTIKESVRAGVLLALGDAWPSK